MSELALVGHQVRYEQKIYWRNPASAFFTFAFPIMFFFIFASVFSNQQSSDLGGIKSIQYYTPSILAYALMSACFVNPAIALATRRDTGVLKRVRGTPLPAWAFVAGLVGSTVVVSALLTVVSVGFGTAVYGVSLPLGRVAPLVATVVLGVIAFTALGIAVSSLVPNAEAAAPIINFPFFVLVFISGTYFPITGGALATIANVFPLRPFILALFRCFDPRVTGSAWDPGHLWVIAAWGAGAALVAARRFRWEPRR